MGKNGLIAPTTNNSTSDTCRRLIGNPKSPGQTLGHKRECRGADFTAQGWVKFPSLRGALCL